MPLKTDSAGAELARTARTRVRLPDSMMSARIFQGWGPAV
jgi:hypothetical protein